MPGPPFFPCIGMLWRGALAEVLSPFRSILGPPQAGALSAGGGRLLVTVSASGLALILAFFLVRSPPLALTLALLPFLLPFFGSAERVFWVLTGTLFLGSESVSLLPYVSVFKALTAANLTLLGIELALRRRVLSSSRALTLSLVAWVALNTLASFQADQPSALLLVGVTTYLGAAVFAHFPVWFLTTVQQIRTLMALCRWQGVLLALFATLQVYGGEQFYLLGVTQAGRAHGLSANPNGLGIALCFIYPLQLHAAIQATSRKQRWLWGLASMASVVGVVLSLSRSALMGVILASMGLFLFPLTRRRTMALLGLLTVLGWMWSQFLGDFAGERYDVEELEDDPRRVALVDALRVFGQHPLLGVGIGEFARESSQGIPVHNAVVSVFVEAGLFAGLLFLWILGNTTLRLYRAWMNAPPGLFREDMKALLVTWVAFFVSVNFHGGTERSNVLWFLVGLSYAIQRIATEFRSGEEGFHE